MITTPANAPGQPRREEWAGLVRRGRVLWAVASVLVAECLVLGCAVVVPLTIWDSLRDRWTNPAARVVVDVLSVAPAYALFAVLLAVLTALVIRVLGWRTPPSGEMVIAEYPWPLLDWGRGLGMMHVVRVCVGTVVRATPLWVWCLRLSGAQIGRGVWINTTSIADHNLLEIGDGTVIGSDVHLSGHTVECGVMKTAPVRIGRGVTIGVGSTVSIGVTIGDRAQVGALSFIPKHEVLRPGGVYVGIPVRLHHTAAS